MAEAGDDAVASGGSTGRVGLRAALFDGRPWWHPALAAVAIVAAVVVGAYALPGGRHLFGSRYYDADGWERVSSAPCGEVDNLGDVRRGTVSDPGSCIAWLVARSYDRDAATVDDVHVIGGNVRYGAVEPMFGRGGLSGIAFAAEGSDQVRLLVVRSDHDRFARARTDGPVTATKHTDVVAVVYDPAELESGVGSMLVSSGSDTYTTLEELVEH